MTRPLATGTNNPSRQVSVDAWNAVISKLAESASLKDFGAVGDGVTDDSDAIHDAFTSGVGHLIVPSGIYSHGPLSIDSYITLSGIEGRAASSSLRPRFVLRNGCNADALTIGTAGRLRAHRMDFFGNSANQTLGHGIRLTDEASSSASANSLYMFDSTVRDCRQRGVFAGANRNGGLIERSFILECHEEGVWVDGIDWKLSLSEIGSNGLSNVYFGADSNDVIGCDLYHAGATGAVVGDKSGIRLGPNVRLVTILGNQINTNRHHGVNAEACDASSARSLIVSGNQFLANSYLATNTYSDIITATADMTISGNAHASYAAIPTKPKYLVETTAAVTRLIVSGARYTANAYGTAVTNDATRVHLLGRDGLSVGDAGALTSRLSANAKFINAFTGSEANPKFSIDGLGIMRWGPGGGTAEDLALLRSTADTLGLAGGDSFRISNTGYLQLTKPDGSLCYLFVDDTNRLRINSAVVANRNADGTIVGTQT